jgi:hypothetical protein
MSELIDELASLRRPSRRVGLAAAAGMAAVAATALVMTGGPDPRAACVAPLGALDGWRDNVERAVTGAARADERAIIHDAVTEFAATVEREARGACEATAAGLQSDALLDHRIACLDVRSR